MRPSPVNAIDGLRWNSAPPSSRSSAPMALVSEGCEMPQPAGRAGETELLAQRQEVMDLLHLHWVALRFGPIIAPAALVGGMLQG